MVAPGMAYDEHLAERVRRLLEGRPDLGERSMFGGRAFLLGGNMCVGIMEDELIVRADPDEADRLLAEGARPFDFTGRPMRGWLFVPAELVAEDDHLARWVEIAEDFVTGLPPKG
jgi:TfoX/Sxy family transcriptional regulator of competence genes